MKRTLSSNFAIGTMVVAFAMFVATAFVFMPFKCKAENNKWDELHKLVVANEELLENAYYFNEDWFLDVLMESDTYVEYQNAAIAYNNSGDYDSLHNLYIKQEAVISIIKGSNKKY